MRETDHFSAYPFPMNAAISFNAKEFPITTLLYVVRDLHPAYKQGKEWYYHSPLRIENTPSFCVDVRKNVWYDFGAVSATGSTGDGGDVLKLTQLLVPGLRLPEARILLAQLAGNTQLRDIQLQTDQERATPEPEDSRSRLIDVSTQALSYNVLIDYLKQRGINWNFCSTVRGVSENIYQVFYHLDTPRPKKYFAVGWKNTAGGLDLRNSRFQGKYGSNSYTFIRKLKNEIVVFEGFMDYLSCLTMWAKRNPKFRDFGSSVLILNSLSNLQLALPLLEKADKVHWFGDNDEPGDYALSRLRELLPIQKIVAYNEEYRGFKDLNDFLTQTPPPKALARRWAAETSEWSQRAKWWLWVVWITPQKDKNGKTHRSMTYYSYDNTENGYASLLQLRHQLQDKVRMVHLCERTKGREFKVLEKHASGRLYFRSMQAVEETTQPMSLQINQ